MSDQNSCTHDCESCGQSCESREVPKEKLNELSKVGKLIGVVSGKGGVGKSMVTALLAVTMRRRGLISAILDGDLTGPSIPKMFGLSEKASSSDLGLFPVHSKGGVSVMSINVLLEDEKTPVIWRGPVISGAIKQFWSEVVWGEVDYMFVDMPPGTGDVPLTAFQSLPLDGIIVVASPQELVSLIVAKAVNMAKIMNVPVLGIVENMAYFRCPDCGKEHKLFGESHVDEIAAEYGLEVLARLPIDPALSKLSDEGKIEDFKGDYMNETADLLEKL